MQLKDLLKNFPAELLGGSIDLEISHLAYDSRRVESGTLFFAIPGTKLDGHDFLEEAVERGAPAAVISDLEKARKFSEKIALIKVKEPRLALSQFSAHFFGYPSEKLTVIGVTGTNGKTTTVNLIEQILTRAGFKAGLLSTIENRLGTQKLPHELTTPLALDLQGIFKTLVEARATHAVMEVSSHSIVFDRVASVKFSLKILTNITQDHLDFHQTFEEYQKVKTNWMNEGTAIKIWPEDWQKEIIPENFPLPGRFNLENAQAAKACARALKINEKIIDEALKSGRSAPGRFEKIDQGQDFWVIVDYAHTPDGLEKILKAAQEISRGRIITVFGCGGDRDRTKRPKMGYLAGLLSDYTIITSDNPRSEEPFEIISEIEAGLLDGLKNASIDHYSTIIPSLKIKPQVTILKEGGLAYEIEPDRAKAIERALGLAQKGDLVILAGKGHEDYQIFKDKTIHFDDREIARQILKRILTK